MRKLLALFTILTFITQIVNANVIRVPAQYPTIQAGINAAGNGDTVLVANGIYTGTGNRDIDFNGRAIVVMSENGPDSCIIDCDSLGRGFYFHSREDSNSILTGFSIINGYGSRGGGIYIVQSSPVVSNCYFNGNSAVSGGGAIAWEDYSRPVIDNCVIEGNTAGGGGGIDCYSPGGVISNCVIQRNAAHIGGGICCTEANTVIIGCDISGNSAISMGGGILCGVFANPTIIKCLIGNNSCDGSGGGIYCFKMSSPSLDSCVITGNSAPGHSGGGIYTSESRIRMERCVVSYNFALEGGGLHFEASEPSLSNCTVSENTAGGAAGGIYCAPFSDITTVNSIVTGNNGFGGVHFGYSSSADISYGDYYDNQGGDFTGNVPSPLGVISTINANGDSCDVYYNIFADPLFYSIIGDSAFHLTAGSPCVDAGDPIDPFDPDSTIADIGAYHFYQRLALSLNPLNPPIRIHSGGGSFSSDISVRNTTGGAITFDAWTDVILPNGSVYGPLMLRSNLNISPGAVIIREMTQTAPGYAPAGYYTYIGRVGEYPNSVVGQDKFHFIKLLGEGVINDYMGWDCYGWFDDDSPITNRQSQITNLTASPNPFNASTVARFELRDASQIKLAVYDVKGREVVVLHEGKIPAGSHTAVFDGEGLSSGIYFCVLQAEEMKLSARILLLK